MTRRKLLPFLCVSCVSTVGLSAALLCLPSLSGIGSQLVHAQDSTSGAISGAVKDKATQEALVGVTVVITSLRQGNQYTAITNEKGNFKVASLVPGEYSVLFVYGDIKNQMPSIRVNIGKVSQLYPRLDLTALATQTVIIEGRPVIDTTKTTQGIVLDKDFINNLPLAGNTFESVIGSAAGAQDDGVGVSFSGSTSLENQYVVDGVNTTGLGYGTVGSSISNEFIEEIEVITGGYMAEHGQSTGGVVNVVTQSGTNDFHGAVFTDFTNSFLQTRDQRPYLESSIDSESNLAYNLGVGAALGGPIIKDKLWFFVGFHPRFVGVNTERITQRRTDCRELQADGTLSRCDEVMFQDGVADVHAGTNDVIYEELDRAIIKSRETEYQFVAKFNYSPTPEHQGQVTFSGTPFFNQVVSPFGEAAATTRDQAIITADVSAKWTSKFNDGKTTVEALLGVHRQTVESKSPIGRANEVPREDLYFGDFGIWAQGNDITGAPRESAKTIVGCNELKYQQLAQGLCPSILQIPYSVGGIGRIIDEEQQRTTAKLSVLQRLELFGDHEIKAGIGIESNFLNKRRILSGNVRFENFQPGTIDVFRIVALAPAGVEVDMNRFGDVCNRGGDDEVACNYEPPGDVKARTFNVAAYLQDSWQIRPNVTLNAGIRYEEQRLRNAEHLQNTFAQGTGERLRKNAMVLKDMWAPRLGLVYDWTKVGRSKVYGSWGRYYESIPLDINDRSFGGEGRLQSRFSSGDCGDPVANLGGPSGAGCVAAAKAGEVVPQDQLLGAGVLVADGIKNQYLDEAILGVEYEVLEGLTLGLSVKVRTLGRVLEDVSTDNAQTYVLANPGEWTQSQTDAYQKKIDAEMDPARKARLESNLKQFEGINDFDKPRRDYFAVEATAKKRFSKQFFMQASYTYSRTEGNYQGLFSSTSGQVDPNITSLFDLPELMANRDGPLPQDRPHLFRFDGHYTFDFRKAGNLLVGASVTAISGSPKEITGSHYLYGTNETMLLPRGSLGRIGLEPNASIRIAYRRELGKGMQIEGYANFLNVTTFEAIHRGIFGVQQEYTVDEVNPIVGGRFEDLVYLKRLNPADGSELAEPTPARKLRNFGRAVGYYAGPAVILGARLTF